MSKKSNATAVQTATSEQIDNAIANGKVILADGKPKIEAAMSIYLALLGEAQETIVSAFIEGAGLTPKGALTYWYNCRRKHSRMKPTTAE